MFCTFCNKYGHKSRNCQVEKDVSVKLKQIVGNMMEYYAANNIKCPECDTNSLCVLNNSTPSCDIICSNCNKMFEIKSKCLSCYVIPDDIFIDHGHYENFISRVIQGLNMIIIIYSANNYNKSITIREVLYINNDNIKNYKIINISKKKESNKTQIFIKNKKLLSKLLTYNYNIISFQSEIDEIMKFIYLKI